MNPQDKEILNYLFDMNNDPEGERTWGGNLSTKVAAISYLNQSKRVARALPQKAEVLDWGAGRGHMTYILNQLDLRAVHYDIQRYGHTISEEMGLEPIYHNHPIHLPFQDAYFDAVISCGTLEHVQDLRASAREISRILKVGGLFFVFNFPYKLSPSEFVSRTFRKSTYHPILFTLGELDRLLVDSGFVVTAKGYENGVPKNLTFLPALRGVYNTLPGLFIVLDKLIISIPIINSLISNSVWGVGKKK